MQVREFLHGDASMIENSLRRRMEELALEERFEDALLLRNRLAAFARGVGRGQQIRSLSRVREMILKRDQDLLLIRHGKLAASILLPERDDQITLEALFDNLRLTAESVTNDGSIIPSGNYEESEKLAKILDDQIELLWIDESDGPWFMSRASAASLRFRLAEDLGDAFRKSEGVDRMGYNSIRTRPSR